MTDIDPQTVREIAREIILDCGRNADDIGTYVWVRVGADLSKHEHGAWCSAIREAIRTAQITASWPTEQQPAAAAGGEQVQDGAAGCVEAWLDNRIHSTFYGPPAPETICSYPVDGDNCTIVYVLGETDLRAVLAERKALAARVAELTAERDEARELACASLDILRNVSDEPMRELFEVDDMDEMPGWFTRYGKPNGGKS